MLHLVVRTEKKLRFIKVNNDCVLTDTALFSNLVTVLTLSLLMSYICVELPVKPEILMSCIYGPTFGKAESHLFLFAAQCFKTEPMQKVVLWHSCV
jgi:hypothetical protein